MHGRVSGIAHSPYRNCCCVACTCRHHKPSRNQRRQCIFTVLALTIAHTLTRLNHLYTRRSSTTLLVFYPSYFVAQLLSLRTSYALLRGNDGKLAVAKIALDIAHVSILLIVWMLECIGPEVGMGLSKSMRRLRRVHMLLRTSTIGACIGAGLNVIRTATISTGCLSCTLYRLRRSRRPHSGRWFW